MKRFTDEQLNRLNDVRREEIIPGLWADHQTVIEFAYLVRDFLSPLIERRTHLAFEEANCFLSCFHQVKGWLDRVDPEYRELHREVVDFYSKEGHYLSNDFDRLHWESKDSPSEPPALVTGRRAGAAEPVIDDDIPF